MFCFVFLKNSIFSGNHSCPVDTLFITVFSLKAKGIFFNLFCDNEATQVLFYRCVFYPMSCIMYQMHINYVLLYVNTNASFGLNRAKTKVIFLKMYLLKTFGPDVVFIRYH